MYKAIYHRDCENFELTYKGQFVVSGRRIRGIDRGVYEGLHEALQDAGSWAHDGKYIDGQKDSLSAPVFGYTLERLWGILFQCSTLARSWQCPSEIGSMQVWEKRGAGCQCVDE